VRGAYSTDGGTTFQPLGSEPEKSKGAGNVAVSADGATIVWSARGAATAFSRTRGLTWTVALGLPPPPEKPDVGGVTVRVASDRVNPKKFYAFDPRAGVAYRSDDGGVSFFPTQRDFPRPPDYKLGSVSIQAVFGREGEVWLTTPAGLLCSADSATTFVPVAGFEEARSVGFGMAAPGRSHPAVYVIGTLGGVTGFFRSDDAGRTFVRINDDQHQYGGGLIILGDPRATGRAYLGTHGRGIFVGEPPK
jgi:hypothetical protein